MQQKTQAILSLVLVFLLVRANARGRVVGGRAQVKDVKSNKEVQDLGRFSVNEYNRNVLEEIPPTPLRQVVGPNSRLHFVEVVEAQTQVVSGIKYYLRVKAMQNGKTRTFEAVVVVKPWEHQSKKLLNFAPSPN